MSVQLCLEAFVLPRTKLDELRRLDRSALQALDDMCYRGGSDATWETARAAHRTFCRTKGRELEAFRCPHSDALFNELVAALDTKRRTFNTTCMAPSTVVGFAAALRAFRRKHEELPQARERPRTAEMLHAWLDDVLDAALRRSRVLSIRFQDGLWSESPDPPTASELAYRQSQYDELRAALDKTDRKRRTKK